MANKIGMSCKSTQVCSATRIRCIISRSTSLSSIIMETISSWRRWARGCVSSSTARLLMLNWTRFKSSHLANRDRSIFSSMSLGAAILTWASLLILQLPMEIQDRPTPCTTRITLKMSIFRPWKPSVRSFNTTILTKTCPCTALVPRSRKRSIKQATVLPSTATSSILSATDWTSANKCIGMP